MNLKSALFIAFVILSSPICALAAPSNVELMYKGARSQYVALFSSPKKMADRAKWMDVINRFRLIARKYPKSPKAAEALYNVGLLYKNMYRQFGHASDRGEAVAAFGEVIAKHPKSRFVADARRSIGDLQFMAKENDQARKTYKSARVKKVVPASVMAKNASAKAAESPPKKTGTPAKLVEPAPKAIESAAKQPAKEAPAAEKTAEKAPEPAPAADEGDEEATVVNLRRYSNGGYTRLVIDLSERTAYRAEREKDSDKLYIDLMDTKVASTLAREQKFGDGMAKGVTFSAAEGYTRVTIAMAEATATHHVLALPNPSRVVIDLNRAAPSRTAPESIEQILRPEPKAEAKEEVKAAGPPEKAEAKKQAEKQATAKPGKGEEHAFAFKPVKGYTGSYAIKTIVIDPGHGGKDPGAIGPTGLKEKDAALSISKQLKVELERRLNCRVVLTRNDDRFLELDERTVFANSMNADLFLSIHLNASRNPAARGIETYFMSPSRSKDEMETASRENMLALKSNNETENDLAYIMSDLINTQKVNESSQLADTVQRAAVKGMRPYYGGVKDKGVKQAMFYVLWRATMPSALVETSFISNRDEERRLRTPEYVASLAKSIASGVENYTRTYMVAADGR